MTDDEIKELKVLHVACKEDYKFFIRYFFKMQYNRKWQQWDHLILIVDVMRRVMNGQIKRLIINVAPRYGKTDVAVKFFLPYCLAINPQSKFIHLSYSDDLALDNSEFAREVVGSSEYQKIFPSVRVKKNSDSKKKWYTEQGGGVYATSTGGQITGFGAGQVEDLEDFEDLFGGAILIDDPNKVDDADSELLRTKVNNRYDSTISNRVNSRNTPIVILQQRTHEQDLSGYVLSKDGEWSETNPDGWHVLCLPSIKANGTALCPQKHTIEELKKLELRNEIVFERQHMQNPTPIAGLLFPIAQLKFYNPSLEALRDPDFKYFAADPANEGGDDFSGIYSKLIGNKIYIDDIIYNTDGTDYNEQQIVKLLINEKIMYGGIEGVMGWAETVNRTRIELERKGWQGELRLLRPRTGKHARITTRAAFIRNHFVFRSDWQDRPQYAKFMRNLTSYLRIQEAGSSNKHDDAPDNCEMIASYFERNFAELW